MELKPEEQITYNNQFLQERLKIRYLNLRESILYYALDNCVKDYNKVGLSESEIECIKNRSYTFLITYRDFNNFQKDNFI